MADVRSMLRAERANRRITHPTASYTSDGKLLCNLCEALVKSETAWQSHLHSTGHTLRLSRAREAATARGSDVPSKKRKASSLASLEEDDRKRAKPAPVATNQKEDVEQGETQAPSVENTLPIDEAASLMPPPPPKTNGNAQPTPSAVQPDAVDDSELAAFERELADLEASQAPINALHSAATISAAPMTAEEIAAQAREEQSAQRGKRDAEIEDEREDAARLLEDEFEEMEELEERVKKLRERREALRTASSIAATKRAVAGDSVGNGNVVVEEEDDEDEDDFDEWGFGGH